MTQNGDFAMEYRLDTTKQEAIGYPMTSRGGPRYDTLGSDVQGEYPLSFEVDGVKYGDAGDYIGVAFVNFLVEGDMVTLSDEDGTPCVVLYWEKGNRYKVVGHMNEDKNTFLHRSLPVGTVFVLAQ